jgi:uncharacterized membrane protein
MTDVAHSPRDEVEDIAHLTPADLRAAMALGWQDMRASWPYGLFFSGAYVAGGLFLLWALTAAGQIWWIIPISLGFPLLGPFIACGFYEISARRAASRALTWRGVLGAVLAQKDGQIPSIAAIVVIFFLFWNFLAHMIFALFMGLEVMTNISSSWAAFASPNGIAMLVVGTGVGAVFAGLLYALMLTALPTLMEREVDFVTAMLISLDVVRQNPSLLLGWGALIAALLFAAMIPAFAGLFIVLPWLGHTSWHLYTRAIVWK